MNLKITLSVLLAFLIAFTALSGFLYTSKIDTAKESLEEEISFFEKEIEGNAKKIFLLGSSHIISINTTHVENYLVKNGHNFIVYNLAKGGDEPEERLLSIDLIISAKPDIVIYGLAERDFRNSVPIILKTQSETENILPNPHDFFDEIIWKVGLSKFDLKFLENPKLATLIQLHKITSSVTPTSTLDEKIVQERYTPYPNMPFFKILPKDTIIRNSSELEEYVKFRIGSFNKIDPPYRNENAIALGEIISELKNNNIKTIIFKTPIHKTYRDIVPTEVTNSFDAILQDISTKYDIEIISLYEKFSNEKIWTNPSHISVNEDALIYSEEIAKIVLDELKKNVI